MLETEDPSPHQKICWTTFFCQFVSHKRKKNHLTVSLSVTREKKNHLTAILTKSWPALVSSGLNKVVAVALSDWEGVRKCCITELLAFLYEMVMGEVMVLRAWVIARPGLALLLLETLTTITRYNSLINNDGTLLVEISVIIVLQQRTHALSACSFKIY